MEKETFRDWSQDSINFMKGCYNGCLYCYARIGALRFKQIKDIEEWDMPVVNNDKIKKQYRNVNNIRTTMFPSTHDIFPSHLNEYMLILHKLLKTNRKIVIVSKPRFECIKRICDECEKYENKFKLILTIGSKNDDLLKTFEPRAPNFRERFESLKYAYEKKIDVEVSCEPLFDILDFDDLYNILSPYAKNIWIGNMNYMHVLPKNDVIEMYKKVSTPENYKKIYDKYKDVKSVLWKTSVLKFMRIISNN
jgi:DNA repair photolyase